jgi:hypothetical protein
VDPEEQFAGADRRYRDGFQTNVIHPAINGGQHGGRNGLLVFFDRELSGHDHVESKRAAAN